MRRLPPLLLGLAVATAVPAQGSHKAYDLYLAGQEARKRLDFEGALQKFTRAHELVKDSPGKLRAIVTKGLGKAFWETGDLVQAEPYLYDAVVELSPMEDEALGSALQAMNSLAYFYVDTDRPAQALPTIEHVVEVMEARPEEVEPLSRAAYYDTYAKALEGAGRLDEAHAAYRRSFEKAFEPELLDPIDLSNLAEGHRNYAAFLERSDREPARAQELALRAEELDRLARQKAGKPEPEE